MASEDCVSEINKFLPGRWKRISKKVVFGVMRVFRSPGHPNAVVLEEGGKLSVFLECKAEKPAKKVLNKKPYYFKHESECGEDNYWIVSKKYWEDHHHFDDQVNQATVNMPHGFHETMEACFQFAGPKAEAIRLLLEAGFTELPGKIPGRG